MLAFYNFNYLNLNVYFDDFVVFFKLSQKLFHLITVSFALFSHH